MAQGPAPSDSLPPDIPPSLGEVRLLISERIDPEAADALWALILNPERSQRPGSGDEDAGR